MYEQQPRVRGKCNILCNGPRMKYYKPNGLYTMGCNFPPVKVDSSCIIDRAVVDKWASGEVDMLADSFVFSKAALEVFQTYKKVWVQRSQQINYLGRFSVIRDYYSSGHWATYACIKMGYTEFDIYGVDSFWEVDISSYTDNFIEKGKPVINPKFAGAWRKSWNRLAMEEGKGCTFNFIDKIEEDGTVVKETIQYERNFRPDP